MFVEKPYVTNLSPQMCQDNKPLAITRCTWHCDTVQLSTAQSSCHSSSAYLSCCASPYLG